MAMRPYDVGYIPSSVPRADLINELLTQDTQLFFQNLCNTLPRG
jgi:hypothetical protein